MQDVEKDVKLTFVPTPSTYISFSVDPVSTIAALDDPEATAAAKVIPNKKYAGYVGRVLDLPLPDRPYHRCEIRLLSQGLPESSDDHCIEPSMCVPVFPATDHPQSREPLHTTKPLPWSNLYHHSYITARLSQTESSPIESRPVTVLADAPGSVPGFYVIDEPNHIDTRSPVLEPEDDTQSEIKPPDSIVGDSDDDNADSHSRREPEPDSDVDFINNVFWQAMFGGDDPAYDTMPVVDLWYDLSVMDELTDPRHLFVEIDALKKIEQESRARSAARMEELDEARLTSIPQPDGIQAESSEGQRTSYPIRLISSFRIRVRRALSARKTRHESSPPDPETQASPSPKKPSNNFKAVVKLAVSTVSHPIVSLKTVGAKRLAATSS
ncbi:hypothetical protein EW146_g197 [Bondarzewia mesenterica]|uniref:Uncharacterized protein n=1 Tax=Bondarzewia mesenterica TaxID=1095465 RepID=A0A4S4MA08_9AGAM|nr:hypothetical protein EW146_g197 [Bondarzewia mesenterica]